MLMALPSVHWRRERRPESADALERVLALTDDLYRRCAPNRFLECRAYGVGGYVDVFNPTEFLDRLPRTGTH